MTPFSVPTPRGPIGGAEIGDGPPVVLVAGLGSTHRIWGDLPRVLDVHRAAFDDLVVVAERDDGSTGDQVTH